MSNEDLLFAYFAAVPLLPLAGGLLILALTESSEEAAKIISVASKTGAAAFSVIACRNLAFIAGGESLVRSFIWMETGGGEIHVVFGAAPQSSQLLVLLTLIALCSIALYSLGNKLAPDGLSAKAIGVALLYEGGVYLSILSANPVQAAVLLTSASMAGYAFIFLKCPSEEDAKGTNLLVISGMAADYMIICGCAMLAKAFGGDATSTADEMIQRSFSAADPGNSLAAGLVLAGTAIKTGFFPFCHLIFRRRLENTNIPDKTILFGSTAGALSILGGIRPIISMIPEAYLSAFTAAAAATGISAGICAHMAKDLRKTSEALAISMTALAAAAIVLNDSLGTDYIILTTAASVAILTLVPNAIFSGIHSTEIEDVREGGINGLTIIYVLCLVSAAGLPPLSGFGRSAAVVGGSSGLSSALVIAAIAATAFACAGKSIDIITAWKGKKPESGRLTVRYAPIVCLAAAAFITELNSAGFITGAPIPAGTAIMCASPILTGAAAALAARLMKRAGPERKVK